jgi:DNA primase large subunit
MENKRLVIHINDKLEVWIESKKPDELVFCQRDGGEYDGDGFVYLTKEEFINLYSFLFLEKT